MIYSNNQLAPCPFCGGKASMHESYSNSTFYVECDGCEASMGHYVGVDGTPDHKFNSKDQAIKAWNLRTRVDSGIEMPHMKLCPDCGNKRCPKAEHSKYACTRSNEPDQLGVLE